MTDFRLPGVLPVLRSLLDLLIYFRTWSGLVLSPRLSSLEVPDDVDGSSRQVPNEVLGPGLGR